MPEFGLPDQTIIAIRQTLAGFPAVEKAILYGSRAKGSHHPGSDIDLTLVGHGLDHRVLARLAGEFEESPIPSQIDLSLWDEIYHDDLRTHVERVGAVFYQRADSDYGESPSEAKFNETV